MKTIFTTLLILFIFGGCATWKGIKKDSSDAWKYTKDNANSAYETTKDAINDTFSKEDK